MCRIKSTIRIVGLVNVGIGCETQPSFRRHSTFIQLALRLHFDQTCVYFSACFFRLYIFAVCVCEEKNLFRGLLNFFLYIKAWWGFFWRKYRICAFCIKVGYCCGGKTTVDNKIFLYWLCIDCELSMFWILRRTRLSSAVSFFNTINNNNSSNSNNNACTGESFFFYYM